MTNMNNAPDANNTNTTPGASSTPDNSFSTKPAKSISGPTINGVSADVLADASLTAGAAIAEQDRRNLRKEGLPQQRIQGELRIEPTALRFEETVWREWCIESGVSLGLYEANVFVYGSPIPIVKDTISQLTSYEIVDGVPVGKKLSNGKRAKLHGVFIKQGYWWVSGVDPETGLFKKANRQYKTLAPSYINGDRVKYLSPSGSTENIVYLNVVPDSIKALEHETGLTFPYWGELDKEDLSDRTDLATKYYWQWVLECPEIPISITEGVKKAAVLVDNGHPCVSIPGVNNIWTKKSAERTAAHRYLCEYLQILVRCDRTVYLAFDSDSKIKPQVGKALLKLAKEVRRIGAREKNKVDVFVCDWNTKYKGIDDYFVQVPLAGKTTGPELLEATYTDAAPINEWLRQSDGLSWDEETLELMRSEGIYVCYHPLLMKYYRFICTDEAAEVGYYEEEEDIEGLVSEFLKRVREPDNGGDAMLLSASQKPLIDRFVGYIKQTCKVAQANFNPPNWFNLANGPHELVIEKAKGKWSVQLLPRALGPCVDREGIVVTNRLGWSYKGPEHTDSGLLNDVLSMLPSDALGPTLDTLACSLAPSLAFEELADRTIKMVILSGGGANGKDVIKLLMNGLHGSSKILGLSMAQIRQAETGVNTFSLMRYLSNPVMNFSSENASADLTFAQTLKTIITGEEIEINIKNKQPVKIQVSPLQFHCTNSQMYFKDIGQQIRKRMVLIKMPYTFCDQREIDKAKANRDPQVGFMRLVNNNYGSQRWLTANIVPLLMAELMGRLESLLNGRNSGVDGIGKIDWGVCTQWLEEAVQDTDPVAAFIASDRLVTTGNQEDVVKGEHLFSAFTSFCVDYEIADVDNRGGLPQFIGVPPGFPDTRTKLVRQFKKLTGVGSTGSNGVRGYKGFKLSTGT